MGSFIDSGLHMCKVHSLLPDEGKPRASFALVHYRLEFDAKPRGMVREFSHYIADYRKKSLFGESPQVLPEDRCSGEPPIPIIPECRQGLPFRNLLAELEGESTLVLGSQDPRSFFSFVEAGWFKLVSAVVILLNLWILFEASHDSWLPAWILSLLNRVTLAFFACEMFCRVRLFGKDLVRTSWQQMLWNFLDLVVVTAGILDEWLFRICQTEKCTTMTTFLRLTRGLRVLRLFKVGRVLLQHDLSWAESTGFQTFVGNMILLNALLLGVETDCAWNGWQTIEQLLLVVFAFELLVRVRRDGWQFMSLSNPDLHWNLLDASIVGSATVSQWVMPVFHLLHAELLMVLNAAEGDAAPPPKGHSKSSPFLLLRLIRLLRILRLARVFRSIRPLYILVVGCSAAVQGVVWCMVLTMLSLYAIAIVATRILGHNAIGLQHPEVVVVPWATVPESIFNLFMVMIGCESAAVSASLDRVMAQVPSVKFAFVFFMVTSSWTLMSIMTAVLSETMIKATKEENDETKLEREEEEFAQRSKDIMQLFRQIDSCGDGIVKQSAFTEWLQTPSNVLLTSTTCGMPPIDIMKVVNTIDPDEHGVEVGKFCEILQQAIRPAQQTSMLKLMTHITLVENDFVACSNNHWQMTASWAEAARSLMAEVEDAKDLKVLASTVHALQEQTAAGLASLQRCAENDALILAGLKDAMERDFESILDRTATASAAATRHCNGERSAECSARQRHMQSWPEADDSVPSSCEASASLEEVSPCREPTTAAMNAIAAAISAAVLGPGSAILAEVATATASVSSAAAVNATATATAVAGADVTRGSSVVQTPRWGSDGERSRQGI